MGGFIVDGGRSSDSSFSELSARFDIPTAWRFVLVRPKIHHDKFGSIEKAAFQTITPPGSLLINRLISICQDEIVPAIASADFDTFAQSLTEFNRNSGNIFAEIQGGPYHGKQLNYLVSAMNDAGLTGIGQSSWGPTLFALAGDDDHAKEVELIAQKLVGSKGYTLVTQPDNEGHRLHVDSV